jgi:hypothetical protein
VGRQGQAKDTERVVVLPVRQLPVRQIGMNHGRLGPTMVAEGLATHGDRPEIVNRT